MKTAPNNLVSTYNNRANGRVGRRVPFVLKSQAIRDVQIVVIKRHISNEECRIRNDELRIREQLDPYSSFLIPHSAFPPRAQPPRSADLDVHPGGRFVEHRFAATGGRVPSAKGDDRRSQEHHRSERVS